VVTVSISLEFLLYSSKTKASTGGCGACSAPKNRLPVTGVRRRGR
jgi:hypothetical protein